MAEPTTPTVTDTSASSINSVNDSIKKQQELLDLSLKANTAMAYLQMALSLTGKISGR